MQNSFFGTHPATNQEDAEHGLRRAPYPHLHGCDQKKDEADSKKNLNQKQVGVRLSPNQGFCA
jgi:hypothetical protein